MPTPPGQAAASPRAALPGRAWTQAHRRWIDGLSWPHPADRVVVDDYLLAIDHLDARLRELDAQLHAVAEADPYRAPVGWLRCFRGIDTLTAILLLAELHDVQRFPTARVLMAYLGLVPGEHSSGERHRRGPITKTGNTLARRLVVEAAWHYRHRSGVSRILAKRRSGQPARVVALADKAQQRLCRRFRRLAIHKPGPVVTVAVARELVGFLWRPCIRRRRKTLGGATGNGAPALHSPESCASERGSTCHSSSFAISCSLTQ